MSGESPPTSYPSSATEPRADGQQIGARSLPELLLDDASRGPAPFEPPGRRVKPGKEPENPPDGPDRRSACAAAEPPFLLPSASHGAFLSLSARVDLVEVDQPVRVAWQRPCNNEATARIHIKQSGLGAAGEHGRIRQVQRRGENPIVGVGGGELVGDGCRLEGLRGCRHRFSGCAVVPGVRHDAVELRIGARRYVAKPPEVKVVAAIWHSGK